MATYFHSELFNVAPDAVWALLVDWGDIIRWMPPGYISKLTLDGEGEGAVRHIRNSTGALLHERLDGADHAHRILHLSIIPPLPPGLLYYRATGIVRAEPAAARPECRLEWMSAFAATPDAAPLFDTFLPQAVRDMFKGLRGALGG